MNLINKNSPNFIGIGMERAGTSWLFTQIASHPEIWVPPLKELHFFDVIDPAAHYLKHRYRYHLPSRIKQKAAPFMDMSYRPEFHKNNYWEYLLWDYYFFTKPMSVAWYKKLFDFRFTKGRISGEITPAYSNLTANTIKIILEMNPEMKFILMIRDPIERIWSGVIHHFLHIKKRDFLTVTDQEIMIYLDKPVSRDRSNLNSILQTWQSEVPEKNLLIQPFEQIAGEPEELIKTTYRFLGVDDTFLPPEKLYKRKINDYSKKNFKPSDPILNIIKEKIAS